MTRTKANNYRWKHGNSNVKASAHTGKSMYDAQEVVRLMVGYAESEVKKFHKSDVSGEFAAFRKIVKRSIGSEIYKEIEKEMQKQAANFR